ncbi:tyrosine--tRNA ligase [Emcibacter sp. SYSU 3D8]|uniref:tyrosine--tRNA ligase n=1 Tax=Emcibacter sp. SYSU 3D8 TaxID=3133969 RepID=UPI0031FEA8C9
MTEPKSDFLRTFVDRGYLHQATDFDALDAALCKGPVTAYIGFDCTAPSLHVGSLLQIMILRHLQQSGHKPVVLMGGGTTKIGDPTGRDLSRQMLTDEMIKTNKAGIRKVFDRFLTFGDGPTDAIMVDNDDWLSGINYISFLRDFGQHFSVNRMLTFDSVRLRLEREQPLSFLEFNYMILQAYDFLELNRRMNCTLQMGGSDQWGNIINGVELGRRVDQADLYGLTSPLMTTSAGTKMGKTAQGAVWLNAEQLSPYDYWQFWRNTDDADVARFLKLFTELPLDEIARLAALEGAGINEAKKVLATEATSLAHGRDAALLAEETARTTFEQGGLGNDLPTVEIERTVLEKGIGILNLLRQAGLSASNGEARRLIQGGGARVNDEKVEDETRILDLDALNSDGVIKLTAGKKRHVIVRPV